MDQLAQVGVRRQRGQAGPRHVSSVEISRDFQNFRPQRRVERIDLIISSNAFDRVAQMMKKSARHGLRRGSRRVFPVLVNRHCGSQK
jgi:hypothetical protein